MKHAMLDAAYIVTAQIATVLVALSHRYDHNTEIALYTLLSLLAGIGITDIVLCVARAELDAERERSIARTLARILGGPALEQHYSDWMRWREAYSRPGSNTRTRDE